MVSENFDKFGSVDMHLIHVVFRLSIISSLIGPIPRLSFSINRFFVFNENPLEKLDLFVLENKLNDNNGFLGLCVEQ